MGRHKNTQDFYMNVTCHAPCLESSLTPSHMHFSMYEIFFSKTKGFCFSPPEGSLDRLQ